jgi:endonuclease G
MLFATHFYFLSRFLDKIMNRKQLNKLFALLRLCWRYPKIAAALLLIICIASQFSFKQNAALYYGEPQAQSVWNMKTWFRTLHNTGFSVGYSDIRGNPLWVEYAITQVPANTPSLPRPSHFSTDNRALNRVSHDSYSKSGYDRGHLAPNHAISQLYGKRGQLDSFLMTNISPQKPKLNRQCWQRLEAAELDYFAAQQGKVWVIDGAVFDNDIERLPSSWRVEIPDAFYKIYISETAPNKPIALAFIMPQDVNGNEPLDSFVTSIDDIEQKTGLDFFANLDDAIEQPLEASSNPELWNLAAVSGIASRY